MREVLSIYRSTDLPIYRSTDLLVSSDDV